MAKSGIDVMFLLLLLKATAIEQYTAISTFLFSAPFLLSL